MVLNSNF